MSSTSDHLDGKADDAKGRVKEAAGSLTDDNELKNEGKVDQASGTAKEKAADVKDAVGDGVDKAADAAKGIVGR